MLGIADITFLSAANLGILSGQVSLDVKYLVHSVKSFYLYDTILVTAVIKSTRSHINSFLGSSGDRYCVDLNCWEVSSRMIEGCYRITKVWHRIITVCYRITLSATN